MGTLFIGTSILFFFVYNIIKVLRKTILRPIIESNKESIINVVVTPVIMPIYTPEETIDLKNRPVYLPLYPVVPKIKKSLHFGLSNYDSMVIYGKGHNLSGTINDATWSYDYAKNLGYNAELCTDLECSSKKLLEFLKEAESYSKSDTILIFSSGHGTLNTMAQGDESGAGLVFADRILYHKELRRAISNLTCKCVIILDHCYSFLSVRAFQKLVNATPKYVYFKDLGIKIDKSTLKKSVLETRQITVNDIPDIKNEFIFFSSSLGNQVSYDLGNMGAFTFSLKNLLEDKNNSNFYSSLEENINKNLKEMDLPQESSVSFINCGEDYKTRLFLS